MAPGEIMISVVSIVLPFLGAMFWRKKCVAKKRVVTDTSHLKQLSDRLDALTNNYMQHALSTPTEIQMNRLLEEQATEYEKKIASLQIQIEGLEGFGNRSRKIVNAHENRIQNQIAEFETSNNSRIHDVERQMLDVDTKYHNECVDMTRKIKETDDATRVEMAENLDKRIGTIKLDGGVTQEQVRKEIKQEIGLYDAAMTHWTNNKLEGVKKDIESSSEKSATDIAKLRGELKKVESAKSFLDEEL